VVEAPMAGAFVFVDLNGDGVHQPNSGDPSSTTDEDGRWSISKFADFGGSVASASRYLSLIVTATDSGEQPVDE
jgi:hypothetical protein